MNCKKVWNDQFMITNLNRTFCEKEYKTARKVLLLERELSKLPETMIFAEQEKLIREQNKYIKEINEKIIETNKILNGLKQKKSSHEYAIRQIKHGNNEDKEKRSFIMACPNNDCRGFLSTQYKCGLCELFTCPHCLEIIGHNKNDPHTCNPDSIASAEFIKKDTKPCPQCGTRIHKIVGCSQMWCTQCHVAFNYNTLKIDTGNIHNPEYYKYMQQQNNGQAPRNPQDLVCGGFPGINLLTLVLECIKIIVFNRGYHNKDKAQDINIEYSKQKKIISDMNRTLMHIAYHDLPRLREQVRSLENHRDLRVEYILGEITKEILASKLVILDKKRKRNQQELNIYELLVQIATENFNDLINYSNDFYATITRQKKNTALHLNATEKQVDEYFEKFNKTIILLNNLREYINTQLSNISGTYNQRVLYIDDSWLMNSKIYKLVNK
tara:strand:- start:1346 stop:2665 length:1320 start_codon:yes stop_codon:yes gene_type:complete